MFKNDEKQRNGRSRLHVLNVSGPVKLSQRQRSGLKSFLGAARVVPVRWFVNTCLSPQSRAFTAERCLPVNQEQQNTAPTVVATNRPRAGLVLFAGKGISAIEQRKPVARHADAGWCSTIHILAAGCSKQKVGPKSDALFATSTVQRAFTCTMFSGIRIIHESYFSAQAVITRFRNWHAYLLAPLNRLKLLPDSLFSRSRGMSEMDRGRG